MTMSSYGWRKRFTKLRQHVIAIIYFTFGVIPLNKHEHDLQIFVFRWRWHFQKHVISKDGASVQKSGKNDIAKIMVVMMKDSLVKWVTVKWGASFCPWCPANRDQWKIVGSLLSFVEPLSWVHLWRFNSHFSVLSFMMAVLVKVNFRDKSMSRQNKNIWFWWEFGHFDNFHRQAVSSRALQLKPLTELTR